MKRRRNSSYSAMNLLKRLVGKAPFKIKYLLADNGKEFTDRFVGDVERLSTGEHFIVRMAERVSI